jgi:hypothetical protein
MPVNQPETATPETPLHDASESVQSAETQESTSDSQD